MAAAGDRIDKFTLVRQLGAGGMGQTWEAVRQNGSDFEQRVAIKLADPDVLDSAEGLESFRREASLAASLRHPNIAAVLDLDDKHGYIVCELVDGADLRSVMRAAPGCRLDARVLVHIVGQIARGLAHAHKRILRGRLSPVIHRDMSPGNIVIDYDGNVKIVDFGIARVLAASGDVSEAINGKLSYMAPEQAMGSRMDGRVDQYALGVIAYEALTAMRPNDGAHEGETLASILGGQHVPLAKRAPTVAPGLVAVFERMLALRPEQRYDSMDAVLDALAPFAPPFTVHRDLVPLVIAARKPHTIVRENGQFISRPVEIDAILSGANAAQPDAQHAARSAAMSGDMRSTVAEESPQRLPSMHPDAPKLSVPVKESKRETARRARAGVASGATRVIVSGNWFVRLMASRLLWHGLTVLGAVLLALVGVVAFTPSLLALVLSHTSTVPPDLGPSVSAPRPQPEPKVVAPEPAVADASATIEAASPPTQKPAVDAPVKAGRRTSARHAASSGTHARESVTASERGLLAAATASAEAADPLSERAPVHSDTTRAAVDAAANERAAAAANEPTPAKPSAERAALAAKNSAEATQLSAAAATDAAKSQQASVRVKVFPWGRVWVDQQPRGSAPPIVQVMLAPGKHVVSVGGDRPIESRTVELAPGADLLVAFDIEGQL